MSAEEEVAQVKAHLQQFAWCKRQSEEPSTQVDGTADDKEEEASVVDPEIPEKSQDAQPEAEGQIELSATTDEPEKDVDVVQPAPAVDASEPTDAPPDETPAADAAPNEDSSAAEADAEPTEETVPPAQPATEENKVPCLSFRAQLGFEVEKALTAGSPVPDIVVAALLGDAIRKVPSTQGACDRA